MTNTRINWSSKFLNDFCAAYDKGIPAAQILKEHGIDAQILSDARIATFRNYYCHKWKPLHYPARNDQDKVSEHRSAGKLTRLEHDVAFLTQEVEFLKKIFLADNKHIKEKRRHPRSTP